MAAPGRPATVRLLAAGVAAAVAWWVVGFAPHLLAGLRLPISQAWPSVLPYSGPRTALPFGQYDAPLLVFLACAAAGLAALVGRVVGGRHRRAGAWVGAAVALVGLVVTMVQTLRVVSPLQAPGIEAGLVVDSAVAASVVGTAVGLLAGLLVARRPGAWRTVGAGVLVVALEPWLRAVVVGAGDPGPTPLIGDGTASLLELVPWVAAVVLGLALAASRPWRPSGLLAWLVVLALAWVVPALATAASYVVAYARSVDVSSAGGQAELVDSGVQVLGMALTPGDRPVGPLLLAVVLGLGVRIARSRARRRSDEDDQPGPEPVVAGSGTSVG